MPSTKPPMPVPRRMPAEMSAPWCVAFMTYNLRDVRGAGLGSRRGARPVAASDIPDGMRPIRSARTQTNPMTRNGRRATHRLLEKSSFQTSVRAWRPTAQFGHARAEDAIVSVTARLSPTRIARKVATVRGVRATDDSAAKA